jgi:hypothetical protein
MPHESANRALLAAILSRGFKLNHTNVKYLGRIPHSRPIGSLSVRWNELELVRPLSELIPGINVPIEIARNPLLRVIRDRNLARPEKNGYIH